MTITINFKVSKCSTDLNSALLLSAPCQLGAPLVWKLAVYVKVTHRPVAPPWAPMKSSENQKKFFCPNLQDPKVASQYL